MSAIIGALAASQAPEFAQHYLQRLAGAEQEARRAVAVFDADAARDGFDRQGALDELARGGTVARARGLRMAEAVERADRMGRELRRIREADPLRRPLVVARHFDPEIAQGAAQDYAPAAPVTLAGGVYGGSGFLLLGLVGGLLGGVFRRPKRKKPVMKARFK